MSTDSSRDHAPEHLIGLSHGPHVLRLRAEAKLRPERNVLAEAFIRGVEVGAEDPSLAGDGDAMYAAFRRWKDAT